MGTDISDDGTIISIKEVEVTAEMLNKAQELGMVPDEGISVCSTCTHPAYSEWTVIKEWLERPENIWDCAVYVQYQMRYCTSCNAAFAREVKMQLSHVWSGTGEKTCQICGMTVHELR